MKTIRIMVFEQRPDALLIHVAEDEEGPLSLPPLPVPFTKHGVAKACGDAGVVARVIETTPGRWNPALTQARNAERAERAQKAREREAIEATLARGAVDPLVKGRGELTLRKHEVDSEIAALKTQLGEAKVKAMREGVYMDPSEFRRLSARLEVVKGESQAIQAKLGELRREEKERNRAEGVEWTRRFVTAAKASLDEETFRALCAAASAGEEDEGGA